MSAADRVRLAREAGRSNGEAGHRDNAARYRESRAEVAAYEKAWKAAIRRRQQRRQTDGR